MKKIYKVLTDCGRVTIPLPIRMSLNLSDNDILSFRQDGDEIIIRKEKLCDNCGEPAKRTANDNLLAILDNLSLPQQFKALTHLSVKLTDCSNR